MTHFAQNDAFEQQKQGHCQTIQANSAALNGAIAQVGNDPAKDQFFQQINEAIIVQEQLSVLLEQGTQFYMKLNDILIKLQQSINDYKFSRDLQKNDLIKESAGGPPANAPPGYGGQPGAGQPGQPGQPG